jgi:outer membrane protein OmpA-like peptidoglycan-associated protein
MFKRHYAALAIACLVGGTAFGQVKPRPAPDTTLIPDYRMDQHRAWASFDESFPARERRMWQVGLNAGMARISGDVRSQMGLGYGATVRKGLGSSLSLRLQANRHQPQGLDWMPSTGIKNNPALNGVYTPAVDYYDEVNGTGTVFHNYRADIWDISLGGLVSLQNILFHHRTPWFSPFAAAGVGVTLYDVSIDQVSDNTGTVYDYSSIAATADISNRNNQLNALQSMLDGTYESEAEQDPSVYAHKGTRTVRPNLSVGAGIGFPLGTKKEGKMRRWEVTLEHRISFVKDDLLDGQRWQDPVVAGANSTLTPGNDIYHYTAMGLHFNFLRNHQEVDWFTNPLTYVYDEINYLEEKTDFRDDDDDGVPNAWDRELDSPEGAVVNPRGETMDSDGDGCPDHEDEEPFSTTAYGPIVDCKTPWPEPLQNTLAGTTKLSEKEVIDRLTDLILNGGGMGEWFLPTIQFDLDKDKIRPDAYDELKQIADLMKKYPKLKVDVYAHCDVRASEKYNTDLSLRRAKSAVDHLTSKYGIDPSRFNSHHLGESENLYPNAKTEAEHQANRRVEFRVAAKDNP